MGLFKEIHCASCGKKTNLIQRTRLKDDQYVCSECTSNIPSFVKHGLSEHYTYADFQKLKEYIEYSGRYIGMKFHETHHYESLHLDANNGYFYFDHGFMSKPFYLQVENVVGIDLIFEPEVYKEGIFTEKVKGDVKMVLGVSGPHIVHTETVAFGTKGNAKLKKGIFKDKVEYENPKGMDEFIAAFQETHERFEYVTENRFQF